MPARSRCGCTKRVALLVTTARRKPIAAQPRRAPRSRRDSGACSRPSERRRSAPGSARSAARSTASSLAPDASPRASASARCTRFGMPLPTSVADRVLGQRRVPELGEQRIDRRGEVVDRVEQRAVEVERDGVDGECARRGSAPSASVRRAPRACARWSRRSRRCRRSREPATKVSAPAAAIARDVVDLDAAVDLEQDRAPGALLRGVDQRCAPPRACRARAG